MSVDETVEHLMDGDGRVVPSPITDSLGAHMLDEGERVKSFIRAEAVGDDETPDGVLGIALVVDICISEGMFLISSYERQIFARGADDVLTGRVYSIYPIVGDEMAELENQLTGEYGFHPVDMDDASVSDVAEADIRNLLPDDDDDS